MNKKKLFCVVSLIFILMIALCACNDLSDQSKNDDKTDSQSWSSVTLSVKDVYKGFLGGFVHVAQEFSATKLKKSPQVSADGLFRIDINDYEFWSSLKLNYDNNDKQKTIGAFELGNEKTGLTNNILGLYVYNDKVYVNVGTSTKFTLDFTVDQWDDYFPFELGDVKYDQTAFAMGAIIVLDSEPVVKTRMIGQIEEYDYKLSIDIAKTLQNILSNNNVDSIENIDTYAEIIASLAGITLEEIKDGNFPDSTLQVNFTTSNKKMAAFSLNLQISDINNSESTIFGDDNIECALEMQKFEVGKTSVSIPFVWSENDANRAEYVYYKDNAFKITYKTTVALSEEEQKEYIAQLDAKVFQTDYLDNYALLEFKDAATGVTEIALYIYKNNAYLFLTENDELVCKLEFPVDLTDIAIRTVNNDFGDQTSEIDWLALVSYCLENLKVGKEGIDFNYSADFYKYIWVTMDDMLRYVDGKFNEDIYELASLKSLLAFVYSPAVVSFRYDTAFILTVADNSEELVEILQRIENAQPELILVERGNAID